MNDDMMYVNVATTKKKGSSDSPQVLVGFETGR
jgi:hypothetical protein